MPEVSTAPKPRRKSTRPRPETRYLVLGRNLATGRIEVISEHAKPSQARIGRDGMATFTETSHEGLAPYRCTRLRD